jgi:hypothetical protein
MHLVVMRGLDPRIHLPEKSSFHLDGWPGPAYAEASAGTASPAMTN